jgi:hypothetical protein
MTLPTSMEPHTVGSVIHAGTPAMAPSGNSQKNVLTSREFGDSLEPQILAKIADASGIEF